ncbi:hypothetical protein, partial [Enterococcus faecium]|uniref:hypothetical protein n=1 Tax=Enterococcus faecium TaxID=1352 RepID=UPI003F43BB45
RNVLDDRHRRLIVLVIVTRGRLGHAIPFNAGDLIAAFGSRDRDPDMQMPRETNTLSKKEEGEDRDHQDQRYAEDISRD